MTNTQNTAENIFNMLDATRERVVTPPMDDLPEIFRLDGCTCQPVRAAHGAGCQWSMNARP